MLGELDGAQEAAIGLAGTIPVPERRTREGH
jgi:hypothetical protein